MIKYIDRNTIENFLKPIYKFLLILNILLIVVLILDTFQIINLDFWGVDTIFGTINGFP